MASASLPPPAMMCCQAARMFQRAAPEEPGLGVTMPTPSLARSSQPLMFLGLPSRTTSTTTESVTMPLLGPAFQSLATRPSSTRRVTSGVREKCT